VWRNLIKSGIREVKHTIDKSHRKKISELHGFRKFFSTQLVNAGLNTEKRWLIEGHALKANDRSYVKPTLQELHDEYIKAIDKLTIDPANRLRKKVELLTIEKSKVDLALSQIEEMKKRIGLT
jgi:hypothetical protein